MNSDQMKAYTELLTIINHMEANYKEKIPKKMIDFFERNSAKEYKFKLDLSIPLRQQKLNSKTLALLAMINLNYWCETEKEKKELMEIYSKNEKIYKEELCEKYNLANILNKDKQEEIIEVKEETSMMEMKESIFKKIVHKISKVLHLNI